ncbi:MAG: hypothetical protein ISR76_09000 [Planctomycetes bacterium]|nr:hypothetical protein [Planctomycetota bacterium]MBL7009122.1 hypothetical protein [Planctomycetota bacterium]
MLLLALLAVLGLQEEPPIPLEELRWNVRPTFTEITKRVVVYARAADFPRCAKSADLLLEYRHRLDRHDGRSIYLDPLGDALARQDAAAIQAGVQVLVRADIGFLVAHLRDDPTRTGATPRTLVLMLKQDAEFLMLFLPPGEQGEDVRKVLTKLVESLARAVPSHINYERDEGGWKVEAAGLSARLIQVLDQAFPDSKPPAAPAPAPGADAADRRSDG